MGEIRAGARLGGLLMSTSGLTQFASCTRVHYIVGRDARCVDNEFA